MPTAWLKTPQSAEQAAGRAPQRAVRLVALIVLAALTPVTSSQVAGPEPPLLQQPTYAAKLIADVEAEAASLQAATPADDNQADASRRASINVRLLAADVLAAGDRAGSQGSTLVLAGMTLAHGRASLGAAFLAAAAQPDRLAALARFNDAFEARQQDAVWTPDSLDESLSTLLRPLSDALVEPPGRELPSHWIAGPMHVSTPGHHQPPIEPGSLEELAAVVAEAELPEELRHDLAGIVDFLQRGTQFPELQPRIARYRKVVLDIVQLDEALREAAWLGDQTRRLIVDRLSHAVSLFKVPETRDAATAQVDRLGAIGATLQLLTTLDRSGFDVRKIAPHLERECAEGLAGANDAADPDEPSRMFSELGPVLQRMIDFQALPDFNSRRELRSIEQDLQRAYRAAEDSLLKALLDSDHSGSAANDPAYASLVAAQKDLLAELQRIRRTTAWMRSMASINHEAQDAFVRQLIKHYSGLLEPARRPDSQAALRQIERQIDSFAALPFEERLKAANPSAITASGGLHEQLVSTITDERRLWAVALSDGDLDGPHSARLGVMRRLTQAMADSADLIDSADRLGLLNRWAAWELDAETLRRPASELISRLKLATASVVAGEDAAAREQLDRVESEAAVVLLAGRLADLLGEDLSVLPGGSSGVLGQLTSSPDQRSFMVDRRGDLASLCRYAAELEHARTAGRAEGARALNAYLNEQALRLIQELR